MAQKTPEEILGLQPGASPDLIRKAFRILAQKFHPDTHPDDPNAEEKFKKISNAYNQIFQSRSDLPPLTEELHQFDLNVMEFIGNIPEGGQKFHIRVGNMKPVIPKSRQIGPKE